jgi:hypothetical protein
MTVAELRNMSSQERDLLFSNMPEPVNKRAINTEIDHSLDQIIRDFAKGEISDKDREALQDDLINLA